MLGCRSKYHPTTWHHALNNVLAKGGSLVMRLTESQAPCNISWNNLPTESRRPFSEHWCYIPSFWAKLCYTRPPQQHFLPGSVFRNLSSLRLPWQNCRQMTTNSNGQGVLTLFIPGPELLCCCIFYWSNCSKQQLSMGVFTSSQSDFTSFSKTWVG